MEEPFDAGVPFELTCQMVEVVQAVDHKALTRAVQWCVEQLQQQPKAAEEAAEAAERADGRLAELEQANAELRAQLTHLQDQQVHVWGRGWLVELCVCGGDCG